MSVLEIEIRNLIHPARLHAEYTLAAFVDYCKNIRSSIDDLDRSYRDSDLVDFYEKQLVEEMEVLARIGMHQFGKQAEAVKIQYIEKDPPDGLITLPSAEKISIECTSAKDSRWEKFAIEQMRQGRIVSFSGYEGSDLTGSKIKGYRLKGMDIYDEKVQQYLVEADDQEEVIVRHKRHIAERIEKKVKKNWPEGRNWLSIFVNESAMFGSYRCMEPTLLELCDIYRDQLRKAKIEGIYFVSNKLDGWMSFHPTKP